MLREGNIYLFSPIPNTQGKTVGYGLQNETPCRWHGKCSLEYGA